MHVCVKCHREFEVYPVINGKRMNCRGRKRCFDCRPIQRRRVPPKKTVRPISLKTCEGCGERFPTRMVILGRLRWLNRRRFCLRCSPFGAHNTSKTPPGDVTPAELAELRRRRRNAKTYRCQKQRRLRRKTELVAAAGGRCVDCGYGVYLGALEFHHRDAATKDFDVGDFDGSFERLLAEVAKCDLLCANCHRTRHAREDADLVDLHVTAESRRRTKVRAVLWFGGTCYGCDEEHQAPLFEFHHWEARDKAFGIAGNGVARSWERTVAELKKCVMLCANCHREVHAGLRTIRPTLLGIAEDAMPYVA